MGAPVTLSLKASLAWGVLFSLPAVAYIVTLAVGLVARPWETLAVLLVQEAAFALAFVAYLRWPAKPPRIPRRPVPLPKAETAGEGR